MLTTPLSPCSSVLPEWVILQTHQPQQHWQQNIIFDCWFIATLPLWSGGWILPGFYMPGRMPRNGHCTHKSSSAHVIFCPGLLLLCTHCDLPTESPGCSGFIRPNWTLREIHTCTLILSYRLCMCTFSRSVMGIYGAYCFQIR